MSQRVINDMFFCLFFLAWFNVRFILKQIQKYGDFNPAGKIRVSKNIKKIYKEL